MAMEHWISQCNDYCDGDDNNNDGENGDDDDDDDDDDNYADCDNVDDDNGYVHNDCDDADVEDKLPFTSMPHQCVVARPAQLVLLHKELKLVFLVPLVRWL